MSEKKKIALALGGGAARGLAHIGVLKVLIRNRIPVDFVVGTSIGSLVGAVYAMGLPIKRIEDIALKTSWWHLTDFVISKMGFLEGMNLEGIIKDCLDEKGFKDLKKPLAVIATDIENDDEVIIKSGDITKAIRASCSIPGIFIPVRYKGRLVVDGGLRNSVPSDIAIKMGADFVIAADVGYCVRRGKVSSIFQVLFQSLQILGDELNKYQSSEADAVIKVDLGPSIDQMAFDKAERIISDGEKTAEKTMPGIISKMKSQGLI